MQDRDLIAMLLNCAEEGECEIHINIGSDLVTVGVRKGYVGDYMRLSPKSVLDCRHPTDELDKIVRQLITEVLNHNQTMANRAASDRP